jgi:nitrogen regulatory protein P-II 1
MVRITCIIKPHRLEAVKSAVAALGVTGLTVADVRGTGNSPEATDWLGGDDRLIALPIRSKLMVVVADELVEAVIATISENARSGESGDGKIFIERIQDAVRVRTEERGDAAV